LVLDPARGRVGEKDVPTIFLETRLLAISNASTKLSRLWGINWGDFFTGLEFKRVDPFCFCRYVNG